MIRTAPGLNGASSSEATGDASHPSWSPDGARLAYNRHAESPTIIDAARPWGEQTPQCLPLISAEPLNFFWATSWSPDGRKLAGWSVRPSPAPGLYTYDFETNGYERLTDIGWHPLWLSDNRRRSFMAGVIRGISSPRWDR